MTKINQIKKYAAQIKNLTSAQREILELKIKQYEQQLSQDELDKRLDRFFMDMEEKAALVQLNMRT